MEHHNLLTTTAGMFLTAMLCCFLWGSAVPGVKIGYELFRINTSHIPTVLLYAGIRFTIAGVLVILFGSAVKGRFLLPTRSAWGSIVMVASVQTVLQYIFYYAGFPNTTGVKGAILGGSNSFFAILLACFVFRQEKFTLRKAIGCLLGFSGVVLINLTGGGLDGGFAMNGEGFVLIAAAAYALATVLMRRFGQKEDPVTITGYQFVLGGIVLCLIGYGMGGRVVFYTVSCVLLIVYLGLVSAGAFTLWSLLLKYNPVSKVTIFSVMTPIFGVVLSILLLHEGSQISIVQMLCALVLVSLGIYTINKPEKV